MGAQVGGGMGGRGCPLQGSYINLAASRSAKYSNTFFITAQQFAPLPPPPLLLFYCLFASYFCCCFFFLFNFLHISP